jgi:hypothetical protein
VETPEAVTQAATPEVQTTAVVATVTVNWTKIKEFAREGNSLN